MKKIIKKALVTIAAATLLFSASSSTYAYTLFGGRWVTSLSGSTAPDLHVYLDPTVSSYGYSGVSKTGYLSWNGISSHMKTAGTTTASAADVKVYAGDLHTTDWADTYNYTHISGKNQSWTGVYAYSRVRINNPELKTENPVLREKVMIHEFGHVMGLARVTDESTKAIMRQGDNKYYTLQTDDKNGLKAYTEIKGVLSI
ncbi:matrixin family metalloprotease [Saccharibacillus alkalitolerans]|uniref:Peptidase M10 metallopeptidase domain-containing protein n=1 Tax=Saccharibacillus alkalitolerans TaxID=2705290 RepID=A0ABX0FBC2_9BACL|nr:matrixin family metalloprotease [Saccharibacillus alkalitolerans]NGZ77265.1 hypothetical protein [Saccharibacillus alkalitolerans]